MINKRIIFTREDGGLSVITPAPEMFDPSSRTRLQLTSLGIVFATDDEVMAYIISKNDLTEGSYRIVDVEDIPADRSFRNAWMDTGEAVEHDMDKAKEIKKQELRELRKPLLEKLDVEYMKALEQGDDSAKDIAAKKQELRDVTKLDLPDNVEELKNFLPRALDV